MPEPSRPERRKHKRISNHLVISYCDLDDPLVRHDSSQIKNISLGGMCLITAKQYLPDTRLGIEVKSSFLSDPIHVEGRVLDSKEKIRHIIYETRLKLNELDDQTEVHLKKIIEHFEQEN